MATKSPGEVSRITVWVYRSLAMGSTAVVAWHTIPIMDLASAKHAVDLSQSKEVFLAKAGVNRIRKRARISESKRRQLKEFGAMRALSNCVERRGDSELRESALQAVAVLAAGDRVAVAQERGLRDALADENCGAGCEAVWEAIAMRGVSAEERRAMLRDFAQQVTSRS